MVVFCSHLHYFLAKNLTTGEHAGQNWLVEMAEFERLFKVRRRLKHASIELARKLVGNPSQIGLENPPP